MSINNSILNTPSLIIENSINKSGLEKIGNGNPKFLIIEKIPSNQFNLIIKKLFPSELKHD